MRNNHKLSRFSQVLLVLAALPQLLHAQTTVTLSTSPNPAKFGAPVVLSAAVIPSSATGSVTFYDGVTVLGAKALVAGTASLATILLPAGNRKLRAYYAGDASNAAATSNVVSQTVSAQPTAGFVGSTLSAPAPNLLAVADFNGDGKADLVIQNSTDLRPLSILLGDGAGNFHVAFTWNAQAIIGSVAAADFNGDGIPDLAISATADLATNGYAVAILLGNGDGTFQPPANYPALSTTSLSVGDFNGDGKADLAIVDSANGVDILLGKGDGTFQPPVPYPASPQTGPSARTFFVLVGDFNGDGKADLATITGNNSAVSILLGNGDGTFQPPSIAATNLGHLFISLALGDFNGDGKADLATNNGILLGNGDGTFQPPVPYAGGLNPASIAVGDFNGDGKTDLAFAAFTVSLMLGKGDGTFQPPVTYVTGANAGVPFVGDFNGDGKTDLAVSDESTNTVHFLLGSTMSVTPTMGTPQSTPINQPFPAQLQVTVMDGGSPMSGVSVTFAAAPSDPFTPTATLSSGATVTGANGVAGVTATADSAVGSYAVTATALGVSVPFSLNNLVGPPFVLTASPTQPQSTPLGTAFASQLLVIIHGSNGQPAIGIPVTFAAPASGASAILSAGTVVTDISGAAVVAATANSIPGSYTVTATAGALSAKFSLTNLQSSALVMIASPTSQSATLVTPFAKPLQVTLKDSSGVPVSGATVAFTAPASGASAILSAPIAVTDVSGVASVTASANNTAGSYAVTASAGGVSATFSLTNLPPPSVSLTSSSNPSTLSAPITLIATISSPNANGRVTFFDGVAILETKTATSGVASFSTALLTAGAHELTAYYRDDSNAIAGTSTVLTQTVKAAPGGAFLIQSPLSIAPSSVVTGDFNGDGKVDLAFPISGAVTVLLGKGDGTFQPAVNYPVASPAAYSIVAGDFNGDGNTDLAVASAANVSILLGNGDGTFRPAVYYLAAGGTGAAISSLAVGDFNGDGKADILFAYTVPPPCCILPGSINVPMQAKADLVARVSAAFSGLSVLPGNGDGTFGAPFGYGGSGDTLLLADFNGDGKPDVATVSLPGIGINPFVQLGNGRQTQVSPTLGTNGFVSSAVLVSGDFNGDGKQDLAVSAAVQPLRGSAPATATTLILLGNGDGTFQPAVSYPVGEAVASGDFNGDGYTDLVLVDSSGNTVGILLGRGDGTFQQVTTVSAGTPLAVADFNGDGKTDILTAGLAHGTATVLLGATPAANPPGPPASITNTGGTPQSALVNSPFPNALQVTVRDSAGLPVPSAIVTFTAPSLNASTTQPSVTVLTNASGVASLVETANNTAGSYIVSATVGPFSTSFALTNLLGGSSNLALGRVATQSSTLPGYATAGPAAAVDGNPDGNFSDGSVTATNLDTNAWWQVDLGAPAVVGSVVIWNRTDCCGSRLNDYWVFLSDAPFLPTDTPATLQNRAGTFGSHQTAAPNPSATIAVGAQGRYLRVQLSGANYLSLAEVQVMGTGGAPAPVNLALGKAADQSNTLPGYPTASASSAVDGNTDGNFFDGSVTATNAGQSAFWEVDLGVSAIINSVVVWNRTDCCASRLSDYWVFISNTPFSFSDSIATLANRPGTFSSHQTTSPNPSASIAAGAQGRYVRVQTTPTNDLNYLSLAEVQVFGIAPPALINLAVGRLATQSSTLPGYPTAGAAAAVDGNTDGNFFDGSVTATNSDQNAWWQVDLGGSAFVNSVVVWNRTDCCSSRLGEYWVFVSDTPFLPTDTPTTLRSRPGTFSVFDAADFNPSHTLTVGVQGRYVRVQLDATNYLSLAEVQVLGTGGGPPLTDLAQGKAATQSSILPGYATAGASAAVDGNQDGNFADGSVTATNADLNAWWQVDLGASAAVGSIVVWNRTDCCGSRLGDFWVFVSDTPFLPADTPVTLQNRSATFGRHLSAAPNPSTVIATGAQGRYVRVQLSGAGYLSLAEVQVFGQ